MYFEDKIFNNDNGELIVKGDYENCTFQNLDFSEINIIDCKFIDCKFHECNLSMVNIHNVSFRDTVFRGCKMLGLRFDSCLQMGISFRFEDCQLNYASFQGLKMKNTKFTNCQIQEVDFSLVDLSNGVFENCDLTRSVFESSNLESVDFRTAYNYQFDAEENKIKKAKFKYPEVLGIMSKYGIIVE